MSSHHSVTLDKMNAFGESRRGFASFSVGNIVGDPFALATIGIAIVSR